MLNRREARTCWEPPSAGGERSPWLAMRRGGDSVRTVLLIPDRCGIWFFFFFETPLWNLVASGRGGCGDTGFGLSVYIRAVARRGRAGPISDRGQVLLAVSNISLSLSQKKKISVLSKKNISLSSSNKIFLSRKHSSESPLFIFAK